MQSSLEKKIDAFLANSQKESRSDSQILQPLMREERKSGMVGMPIQGGDTEVLQR